MQTPTIKPIDVSYKENPAISGVSSHFHNSYEMIYIVEGAAQCTVADKTYTVTGHSLLFLNHFESHELIAKRAPYRRYLVLIRPDFLHNALVQVELSTIFKNRPHHFNPVIKLNQSDYAVFDDLFKQLNDAAASDAPFNETMLASQLTIILILLYRRYKLHFPLTLTGGSAKTVLDVQKYIEDHAQEPLTLAAVAKKFCIERCYLSHQFTKITGFTFKDHIIRQRISQARNLLFYSDKPITTVGLDAGFNNVNHFIRIFKEIEGVTPYQYRKRFREQ